MKFNRLHHACAIALVAFAPFAIAQTATTSGSNAAASATSGNKSAVSTKGSGTAQTTTPAGSMSQQGDASATDKGAGGATAPRHNMSHDSMSHNTMSHDAKAHDATTHAAKRHARSTGTQAAAHASSPYHDALKHCMEGATTQRDSCIDQAINQYGRT
jgi:hypothetical protein